MNKKYVYKIVNYNKKTGNGTSPYADRPMSFSIGNTTKRRRNDNGIYAFKTIQDAFNWAGQKEDSYWFDVGVILECEYEELGSTELVSGKIVCKTLTPIKIAYGLITTPTKIKTGDRFKSKTQTIMYTEHGDWIVINGKNVGKYFSNYSYYNEQMKINFPEFKKVK